MSELTLRGTELIDVLHGILKCLDGYPDRLGQKYADLLRPLVDRLEYAVFFQCSVAEAREALIPIRELMHTINGAATKGDHDIFPRESDLLNHYWELETIFQETRYSGMNLVYDREADRP